MRKAASAAILVVVGFLGLQPLRAQWQLVQTAIGSGSLGPMVYDPTRQTVVVCAATGTFAYDPLGWVPAGPPMPTGCMVACHRGLGALVAYDAAAQRTYLLQGNSWVEQFPAHVPTARTGAGLLYHEAAGVVVLYGGWQGDITNSSPETWHFDGIDWTQHASGLGRDTFSFYYDRVRGVAVAAGGYQGYIHQPVFQQATYDGTTWTTVGTPPLTIEGVYAFDPSRARAVVVRTQSNGGFFGGPEGTYEVDGLVTTRRTDFPSPFAVGAQVAVAYDELRHRLFALSPIPPAVLGTWEFVPEAFVRPFGTPCAGTGRTAASLTATRPLLGQSLLVTLTGVSAGETAVFAFGFSDQVAGGVPLPIALDALGMNGCVARVALDQLAMVVASGTTATHSETVPYLTSLLGVPVFAQALHTAAGVNPAGALVSNGVALTLGL